MNCKQAQQDLQLYIDGRLHQRRFSLVEAHLDTCLDCRHTLALYEIMQAALQDPVLEREPSNLTTLIMARIAMAEQRKVVQSAQPFAWRWGDAVLASLLGTASTALFLLINPTVRNPVFLAISHTFPMLGDSDSGGRSGLYSLDCLAHLDNRRCQDSLCGWPDPRCGRPGSTR